LNDLNIMISKEKIPIFIANVIKVKEKQLLCLKIKVFIIIS
jgi:hypothetical protein